VPPLRERREDLPLLIERFLKIASERHHKSIAGFDDAAMRLLGAFDWPGNVRELQNEVERAVALARNGQTIGADRLSSIVRSGVKAAVRTAHADPIVADAENESDLDDADGSESEEGSLRQARAAFEARYIADVLRRCEGNISRAARVMGVSRVQLQRKVKEYGLR